MSTVKISGIIEPFTQPSSENYSWMAGTNHACNMFDPKCMHSQMPRYKMQYPWSQFLAQTLSLGLKIWFIFPPPSIHPLPFPLLSTHPYASPINAIIHLNVRTGQAGACASSCWDQYFSQVKNFPRAVPKRPLLSYHPTHMCSYIKSGRTVSNLMGRDEKALVRKVDLNSFSPW